MYGGGDAGTFAADRELRNCLRSRLGKEEVPHCLDRQMVRKLRNASAGRQLHSCVCLRRYSGHPALERAGADTVSADNAPEALRRIEQFTFDAAVASQDCWTAGEAPALS